MPTIQTALCQDLLKTMSIYISMISWYEIISSDSKVVDHIAIPITVKIGNNKILI